MRVIIAGSRNITRFSTALIAIKKSKFVITKVVSGMARGVDRLGEYYAHRNHLPVKCFPANWHEYGKSAGYRRNVEMANYADALIAIWDGESKGTLNMINIAKSKGLKVFVYQVK